MDRSQRRIISSFIIWIQICTKILLQLNKTLQSTGSFEKVTGLLEESQLQNLYLVFKGQFQLDTWPLWLNGKWTALI